MIESLNSTLLFYDPRLTMCRNCRRSSTLPLGFDLTSCEDSISNLSFYPNPSDDGGLFLTRRWIKSGHLPTPWLIHWLWEREPIYYPYPWDSLRDFMASKNRLITFTFYWMDDDRFAFFYLERSVWWLRWLVGWRLRVLLLVSWGRTDGRQGNAQSKEMPSPEYQ